MTLSELRAGGFRVARRGSEGPHNRNAIDQVKFELKSLILAQIERWRHALHMQVERERGQPRVEWRTGE